MKMSKPRSRVRRIKLILWIIHSVLYSRKPPKKKRKEYYIWRRHMWSKKSLARACYSYVHKPTFVSYVKNQRVPVSFFHQGEALEYIFVLLFHWLWILQIHEQESGMGFFLYIYIYIYMYSYKLLRRKVYPKHWEIHSRVVTKRPLKLRLLFLSCAWLQSLESCTVHSPTCTELGCMLLLPAIQTTRKFSHDEWWDQ